VILIAGGYDKKIPRRARTSHQGYVKILVLTGATGPKIKAAVEQACNPDTLPVIIEEPDFKKAVLTAASCTAR
jgi:UDP-N-acetylmuramoylalanine-D-glutamate ligase